MVNNCLKIIQGVLFPPLCLLCDAPVMPARRPDGRAASGMDLCAACAAELPYIEHACTVCALPLPSSVSVQAADIVCGACLRQKRAFDYARAVFHYRSPIDSLILGLKFNSQLSHARLLGQLMAERLALNSPELPDLLVPVPLHPHRLRERGFNQSMELGRHLGQLLAVPVAVDACQRRRNTVTQSSLPASERRLNVRNAFVGSASLRGCYVAIIDDVMTTACTANELARTLRQCGARRVDVWVCARVSI